VNSFFSNLDTNQDDLVGAIEFESGMAKLEQQMKQAGGAAGASGMFRPAAPARKVFDTADTNKDGIVTRTNWRPRSARAGETSTSCSAKRTPMATAPSLVPRTTHFSHRWTPGRNR
jgi:hypothetical protein